MIPWRRPFSTTEDAMRTMHSRVAFGLSKLHKWWLVVTPSPMVSALAAPVGPPSVDLTLSTKGMYLPNSSTGDSCSKTTETVFGTPFSWFLLTKLSTFLCTSKRLRAKSGRICPEASNLGSTRKTVQELFHCSSDIHAGTSSLKLSTGCQWSIKALAAFDECESTLRELDSRPKLRELKNAGLTGDLGDLGDFGSEFLGPKSCEEEEAEEAVARAHPSRRMQQERADASGFRMGPRPRKPEEDEEDERHGGMELRVWYSEGYVAAASEQRLCAKNQALCPITVKYSRLIE